MRKSRNLNKVFAKSGYKGLTNAELMAVYDPNDRLNPGLNREVKRRIAQAIKAEATEMSFNVMTGRMERRKRGIF